MLKFIKCRLVVKLALAAMVWYGVGSAQLAAGEDGDLILADFETDADQPYAHHAEASIVEEHAKSGKRCLKIEHVGEGYPGIDLFDPKLLKKFGDYPIFAVDIYNPSEAPIHAGARCDDALSKNYGTRFNEDGLMLAPGWSTLRINLTGMTTSNSNNFLERRPLDLTTLKQFSIFLVSQNPAKPQVVYFDNVRLEGTGLPKVEGLVAYDFGPSSSAVFPGFVGVHEKSIYSPKTGYGWGSTMRTRRPGNPDDLGGDYGTGNLFTTDLRTGPGEYVVHLCIDSLGEWGGIQYFHQRTVTINDKEVLRESLDGETFMREKFFKFIDGDDLPGIDIWTERVMPLTPIRIFNVSVGVDNKLTVKVDAQGGWPGLICFLVAYPKAQQAQGDTFMAALGKRRKMLYENAVTVVTPRADHPKVEPTAAEKARGFLYFSRTAATEINTHSQPTAAEHGAAPVLAGCRSERLNVQLGLVPLKDAKAVKVSVGDFSGPGGAKIANSLVTVRKARIFAKRGGRSGSLVLMPYLLQKFETLPLSKDVTRSLYLTLTVPADATPGDYTGAVNLDVDGAVTVVPVKLTVHGFTLAAADGISISPMGTTAGFWRNLYPGLNERWWAMCDKAFADAVAHGCNAITGGPGMRVISVKDGKAEIDFTDADRWMDLAQKYGLTMPGDSYQGFDVQMGFNPSSAKDCMETNEKNAQQKWGLSFEALLRAVYGTVEAHAKEKGWPARSYYLLDEPRPEFGNIESALELLKLYAKAVPNVRISGYTTVSAQGREKYIPYLPVVITHPTEDELQRIKAAGKECWSYGGIVPGHEFGRWLYAAQRKGIKGYTVGFMYVNSNPYFDFSDVEGSWGIVHPAPDEMIATIKWERLAGEVNCYRYLKTLENAVAAARQAGKSAAAADAAQKFLDGIVSTVDIGDHHTAHLDDEAWAQFQAELLKHLNALQK